MSEGHAQAQVDCRTLSRYPRPAHTRGPYACFPIWSNERTSRRRRKRSRPSCARSSPALSSAISRFRPEDERGVEVWTLRNYWFRAENTFDRTNTAPRFMNWFGVLGPGRLRISVEINVVPKGINRKVRGFFARDNDSGALCLMHTGDIAGGVPGIGGRAFRAIYGRRRLEVSEPEGRVRFGFVVIRFGEEDQTYSARQYVDSIVAFRQAVADGEIDINDPPIPATDGAV